MISSKVESGLLASLVDRPQKISEFQPIRIFHQAKNLYRNLPTLQKYSSSRRTPSPNCQRILWLTYFLANTDKLLRFCAHCVTQAPVFFQVHNGQFIFARCQTRPGLLWWNVRPLHDVLRGKPGWKSAFRAIKFLLESRSARGQLV